MYIFYEESRRAYTGRCANDSTAPELGIPADDAYRLHYDAHFSTAQSELNPAAKAMYTHAMHHGPCLRPLL